MPRQRLPEDVRKEEILNACDKLYQEKGFREITIKDISTETSFSRPSIYNYFETKEEIFLGLLTREYNLWAEDLKELSDAESKLSVDNLPGKVGETLEARKTLLKIMAMNIYEIEESSRLERLVEYKVAFKEAMETFAELVRSCIPATTPERLEQIRYAFFPFMNGIYPYVYPTAKQCEAMDQTEVTYRETSIAEVTANMLSQILR